MYSYIGLHNSTKLWLKMDNGNISCLNMFIYLNLLIITNLSSLFKALLVHCTGFTSQNAIKSVFCKNKQTKLPALQYYLIIYEQITNWFNWFNKILFLEQEFIIVLSFCWFIFISFQTLGSGYRCSTVYGTDILCIKVKNMHNRTKYFKAL